MLLLSSLAVADPASGPREASAKIVNGVSTFEWPAVVAVLGSGGGQCSGVLIGCETVITAAHCVCGQSADSNGVTCQPGGPNFIDPAFFHVAMQHGPLRGVVGVSVPLNYEFSQAADLALLKLSSPVTGIVPARINTVQKPALGTPGTLVGFGITQEDASDAGLKREGRIVTAACPQQPFPIPDSEYVCWNFDPADPASSPSSGCHGDSGGALLIDFGSGDVLAGLVSGGGRLIEAENRFFCHIPPNPGFGTNLFVNRAWIESVAGADLTNARCGALPQLGQPGAAALSFSGQLSPSAAQGVHSFEVPAGTALMFVTLNGDRSGDLTNGVNDFDLYVKAGSPPSTAVYDCRSFLPDTFEACKFVNPPPGTWYVLADRFVDPLNGVGGPGGEYQITATLFSGAPLGTDRLLNISTNGFVDSSRGLIAGFIVEGTEPRRFVIMGENAGSLPNPVLRLTDGSGTLLAENDDWPTSPSAWEIVSELRSPGTRQDAAFAVTLAPGVYLAALKGGDGSTGAGIVSVTELISDAAPTRLINISTNGFVDARGMIAGFIVNGPQPRRFVIMGENAGSLPDPRLQLTDFSGAVLADNDNWQDHASAEQIPAPFRAQLDSPLEAAFVVTLPPGVYLATLAGSNHSTGAGLISITELPISATRF
jgi:hypothetical protein